MGHGVEAARGLWEGQVSLVLNKSSSNHTTRLGIVSIANRHVANQNAGSGREGVCAIPTLRLTWGRWRAAFVAGRRQTQAGREGPSKIEVLPDHPPPPTENCGCAVMEPPA